MRKGLQTCFLTCAVMLVGACSQEPPPRTVSEFIDDPVLLEAALVRCTQNRSATRYEAECVNVREAVKQVEAKEEARRKAELEAASQRKREALRRTQEAAAAARRRVAEAEKRRQEAEYLAQFGVPPEEADTPDEAGANVPMAVIPDGGNQAPDDPGPDEPSDDAETQPAPTGANAPLAETAEGAATELESVREELRRRNDESGS